MLRHADVTAQFMREILFYIVINCDMYLLSNYNYCYGTFFKGFFIFQCDQLSPESPLTALFTDIPLVGRDSVMTATPVTSQSLILLFITELVPATVRVKPVQFTSRAVKWFILV